MSGAVSTEMEQDVGNKGSQEKEPTLEDLLKAKEEAEKERKAAELAKYWKAIEDNPMDFTGWTYLLQFVEQEVIIF